MKYKLEKKKPGKFILFYFFTISPRIAIFSVNNLKLKTLLFTSLGTLFFREFIQDSYVSKLNLALLENHGEWRLIKISSKRMKRLFHLHKQKQKQKQKSQAMKHIPISHFHVVSQLNLRSSFFFFPYKIVRSRSFSKSHITRIKGTVEAVDSKFIDKMSNSEIQPFFVVSTQSHCPKPKSAQSPRFANLRTQQ